MDPRRNRCRGFTLVEVLMVIVIIGAVLAITLPSFRTSTVKSAVRGAADAISSLHAVARAAAIRRGRTADLVLPSGSNVAVVVAAKVSGSGLDTIGAVTDLAKRFGVTVTSSKDTVAFSPRGIGNIGSTITIILSKSTFAETLTVAPGGRLKR